MPQPPPDGLPVYRLLTGSDDDAFCRRVSEALELGYQLYGSPAVASDRDRDRVTVAQALLWPARLPPSRDEAGSRRWPGSRSAETDDR
jgi:hypothetical protein